VILIDTSAWIEFLRDTGSEVCNRVDSLIETGFATCPPVRMEVLAGARDAQHLADLRGLLGRGELLPTAPEHFESAASLYRICRHHGETVRKLIDCLIAAHAIGAGASVLQADTDFETLARWTELKLA